jgi:ATP-dependent exoDNAse (exonuclease V) alpha subunit
MNSFVTINNVYTACSRAKEHLDIVTESLKILNSACLRKQRYVYDKLHQRINQSLPIEM